MNSRFQFLGIFRRGSSDFDFTELGQLVQREMKNNICEPVFCIDLYFRLYCRFEVTVSLKKRKNTVLGAPNVDCRVRLFRGEVRSLMQSCVRERPGLSETVHDEVQR